MNMKKAVRKIVALSAGGIFIGATMASAMAATTLADYPAPFIKDGKFMGKIIVGADAATSDVLGAIDIAASLQEASSTDVDTGTGGTTTTLLGDAISISKSNDLLELGEDIGDVRESLTEADLDALRGGTLTTDQGTTDYSQYLRFKSTTAPLIDSAAVVYEPNDAGDQMVGDWLHLDIDGDAATSGDAFFEYEIVFSEGLESEIKGSAAPYDLRDMENEVISVMGSDFVIVDTVIADNSGPDITLNLLGGDVVDTLREGETKTYTIDGQDYEVTAVFISDASPNTVKFSVNSQLTDELEESDTDKLQGGLEIGVQDILTNQRDGIVEFYLGANKIQLRDNNASDSLFDSSGAVTVQTESIEDAIVQIKGAYTSGSTVAEGNKYEITSIKYRLIADATDELYIPPGHGVREYLDEPEGMLNPNWDIKYEGFVDVDSVPVVVDGSSDQYKLTVTNMNGQQYKFNVFGASTDGASTIRSGKSEVADKGLIFREHATVAATAEAVDDFLASTTYNVAANASAVQAVLNINKRSSFVLSEGADTTATSGYDKDAVSRIMTYDSIDTSNHQITFTDLAGGTVEQSYTTTTGAYGIIGTAQLNVGGKEYLVYVSNYTNNPLAIDLNGDGEIDGDYAHFTVKGGGALVFHTGGGQLGLNESAVDSQANMSLVTLSSEFDENDGNEYINWSITSTAGDVGISSLVTNRGGDAGTEAPSGTSFVAAPDDNDEHQFGASRYGVLVDLYSPDNSNDPEELTLDYPAMQRGVQVFVTAGAVESSKSTTGDGKAKKINPIGIGLATLDKDAPAIGSTPLLVVGGPCANTVAAELMGNPVDCLTGFQTGKAMIKLYADKNALLVAGRDAIDTQGASYVLADYGQYDLTGTEVEVTVTSLDDLRVTPMG